MTENAHRGLTGDLVTDAVEYAGAVFHKNAWSYYRLMDVEDEKQEWILHVLTYLPSYDPAKGALTTWVSAAWRTWWSRSLDRRLERRAYERRVDTTPGAFDGSEDGTSEAQALIDYREPAGPPVHDSSPLVEELLSMVPERRREALFDSLALGAAPSLVAGRHGLSTSAVQKWAKEARRTWWKHYGIEPPATRKRVGADATHCAEGHEFTPENTGRKKNGDGHGSRYCIKCSSRRRRETHLARRADVAAILAA